MFTQSPLTDFIKTNNNLKSKLRHTKLTGIVVAILMTGIACSDTSGNVSAQENAQESVDANVQDSAQQVDATQPVNKQTAGDQASDKPETKDQGSTGTINATSNDVLPTLEYSTSNLSEISQKVNSSDWQAGSEINQTIGTKLQALLNWNNHGVGAVDGKWGKNTRKAMQAFQKAKGLNVTDTLNQETWDALNENSNLVNQPVLVNYTLKDADVNIKTTKIPTSAEAKGKLEGMYYESVPEAIAEKFHIDLQYLKQLNPSIKFKSGETITVYNPGNPNTTPISRVVADKNSETLFAYDKSDNMVASYPTTVGSTATPSPSGTHKVKVKVHEPNYTYTADDGSQTILPPGANNPVGLVWIGLTKPSYGIHGSPDPERISRQASSGCVRLTNWDALALFDVIDDNATVEFK